MNESTSLPESNSQSNTVKELFLSGQPQATKLEGTSGIPQSYIKWSFTRMGTLFANGDLPSTAGTFASVQIAGNGGAGGAKGEAGGGLGLGGLGEGEGGRELGGRLGGGCRRGGGVGGVLGGGDDLGDGGGGHRCGETGGGGASRQAPTG
jgi:hypothetical protein